MCSRKTSSPRKGGRVVTVDRKRIEEVAAVIAPYVRVTPVLTLSGADFGRAPFSLTLKLELLQHSGSFKVRGVFANLLLRPLPTVGVAAASGGNHGVAVAYAAMRLGVKAKIFVPTIASPAKVQRVRADGADLAIVGDLYADALAPSEAWVAETGALAVHAFDQVETLLGQGTLGMELAGQAPALDTVLVAVGGGGLIGGVAGWEAGHTRGGRVGAPVAAPPGGIAADSLAPRRVGELMFPIARAHIAQVALVSDAAIR